MRIMFYLMLMLLVPAVSYAACDNSSNSYYYKRHSMQQELFDQYDTNGNGAISLAEYIAGKKGGRVQGSVNYIPFLNYDTDKSGDLSIDEWREFSPLKEYVPDEDCFNE